MPVEKQLLTAVHFFFLLKEDQKDMQKLWSRLSPQAAGKAELPALQQLDDVQEDPSGYCHIVHRVRGEDLDLCLVMLADLSVLQVMYHLPASEPLIARWRQAMLTIEKDRLNLKEDVTVFGETSVLIALDGAEAEFLDAAESSGAAGGLKISEIDPAASGGGHPLLCKLASPDEHAQDLYALYATEPEALVTTNITQIDSLIKKLSKSSAYFEEQRNTIIRERIKIDREIGELLHHYVMVSDDDGQPDAALLESRVDSLSQMFGFLATDSLLVRQAAERLQRDIAALEKTLASTLKPGGKDEIGDHYLGAFKSGLLSARDEAANLEFSRENANAAIDVVRTQVELLRAGEEAAIQGQTRELLSRSLVLQQERLSLQVAAGFVEFVLLFYYLLKSWEGIAGMEVFEHIPSLYRMLVIGALSASAALGTHFLAQTLSHRTLKNKGLWISTASLVLSFIAAVILTVSNA